MSTHVTLSTNGQVFAGWKSVRISRGLEQFAGTFELECADRWAIAGETPPILEGQSCQIQVYGQTVLTGFIDSCNPRYDKESHSLTISGRDAAGDLVDCAAVSEGFGVLSQTLLQIAQTLCKPFGVKVSVAPGVSIGPAFQYQRINVGETIFNVLSRLAQIRGVLVVSDGQGGIQFTQAGLGASANTQLQLGVNILSAEATHSVAQRFRTYLVYGQGAKLLSMQQVVGSATDPDPAIRSARVTHVDPVEPTDIFDAQNLAQWTANTRRAQGQRGAFGVLGWQDGNTPAAPPWGINQVVNIQDPWARFQGDFLIAGVDFTLDEDGGELTTLHVTPRDAFTLIPHIEWRDDVLEKGSADTGDGE